jgi:hypothetical protein
MWDRSILAANTAQDDSLYDPNLTTKDIERIEMDCVQAALSGRGGGVGELRLSICHVRRFSVQLSYVVGASQGSKTDYLLVQYEHNGSVHGWPVTLAYLKSQGAPI